MSNFVAAINFMKITTVKNNFALLIIIIISIFKKNPIIVIFIVILKGYFMNLISMEKAQKKLMINAIKIIISINFLKKSTCLLYIIYILIQRKIIIILKIYHNLLNEYLEYFRYQAHLLLFSKLTIIVITKLTTNFPCLFNFFLF